MPKSNAVYLRVTVAATLLITAPGAGFYQALAEVTVLPSGVRTAL